MATGSLRVVAASKAIIILLLAFSVEIASRALDNDSSSSQKPLIASREENLVIDLKNGSPSTKFEPVTEFQNPLMESLLINAIKSSASMVSQIEGINKYAIMLNSSDRKKVNVKLMPTKISASYRENTKAKPKNILFDSDTSSTKIDAVSASYSDILSNSILRKRQENSKKFLDSMQNKTGESNETTCNCSKHENSSHVHEYENKISTENSLNGDVRKNSITNELQREIATLNVFTKLTEFEQSSGIGNNQNISSDSSLNDIKSTIVKKIDEGENLPIVNLFNSTINNKFSSVSRNVKDSSRLIGKNIQSSESSNSEAGSEIKILNLNNESDSRGKSRYNDASVKVNKVKSSNNTDQLNSSQNVGSEKNKLNSNEKENYPDLNLFKKAVNEAAHRFASHKVPDFLLNAYTEADEFDDSTYESTTLETTTTLSPNLIVENKSDPKSSKSLSTKVGGFLRDDLVASGSERPRITQSNYDLNNIRIEQSEPSNTKNPKRLENSNIRDSITHPAYLRKVTKIIKRPALPLDNVDLTTDSEYLTTTVDITPNSYVDFTTITTLNQETTTKRATESLVRNAFSLRSSTTSPITYVKTSTNVDRGNRGSNGRHSLNAGFLNISDSFNENEKTNVLVQNKFEKSAQKSQSTTRRSDSRLFTTTKIPTTTENIRNNRIPSYTFTTFLPYSVQETTTQNVILTPFDSNIKYSSKTVTNERGNKKYVPSKFETISPFFSDSLVKKIYSETGELIEAPTNPELEKDRGNLRFINFTGKAEENIQNTENPLRNRVTNVNRAPINLRTQGTFSSFNENTQRTIGQTNNRFNENSQSSFGESNKFTSAIPTRGRTQNQISTTTSPFTARTFAARTFTTTTNSIDSTDSFTTEYNSVDVKLPQRNTLYPNNYRQSISTAKPYDFGSNQDTIKTSINSYQNTQEKVNEQSTTLNTNIGNVYLGSTFNKNDVQSDSLNSGTRSQFLSSSTSSFIKSSLNLNEKENNAVSQGQLPLENTATKSQFSSSEYTFGTKPFVDDLTKNTDQSSFNRQSDNFGLSDLNNKQVLSTYNAQNFQNNLKQQSFSSFDTITTQTPFRFTDKNVKIYDSVTKSVNSFGQTNTENLKQNEDEYLEISTKPNSREDLYISTIIPSSFKNVGEIQNKNENSGLSNVKLTVDNSKTRGNVLPGLNQESSTVDSNFNYVANNINLSLNPANNDKTPTRSNLVPGESGFDVTQSGKSTLLKTDNRNESSTEYRSALNDKKYLQSELKLNSEEQIHGNKQIINTVSDKTSNNLKVVSEHSSSNDVNKTQNVGGISSGFIQSNLNFGFNDNNNNNIKNKLENPLPYGITNTQNRDAGKVNLSSSTSKSDLSKLSNDTYNIYKSNEGSSSFDNVTSVQNIGGTSSSFLKSNINSKVIGQNNVKIDAENSTINNTTDFQQNNITEGKLNSVFQSNFNNKENSSNNLDIGKGNTLINGVTNSQNYNIGGSLSGANQIGVLQSTLYKKANDSTETSSDSTFGISSSQSNINTKSSSFGTIRTNSNVETRNKPASSRISDDSKITANTLKTGISSNESKYKFNTNNPVNSDLQHGESSNDKLASSFSGKSSEKPNQFLNIDSSSDLEDQVRGSKKYSPTKFETISPYLTDSHLKNLYIGNEKSQVGKTSNTIKYNEGTLTIEESNASPKDSTQSGSSKTSQHHFRGNVKYQWNPVNTDWLINDHDFPSQFSYNYNTPEGIMAYQKGVLREINSQKVFIIKGSYQYTAPDGSPVIVNYTADEHGFHPEVVTPAPVYVQEILSKSNAQAEEIVEKTV